MHAKFIRNGFHCIVTRFVCCCNHFFYIINIARNTEKGRVANQEKLNDHRLKQVGLSYEVKLPPAKPEAYFC
jgi:hypothetical protein